MWHAKRHVIAKRRAKSRAVSDRRPKEPIRENSIPTQQINKRQQHNPAVLLDKARHDQLPVRDDRLELAAADPKAPAQVNFQRVRLSVDQDRVNHLVMRVEPDWPHSHQKQSNGSIAVANEWVSTDELLEI